MYRVEVIQLYSKSMQVNRELTQMTCGSNLRLKIYLRRYRQRVEGESRRENLAQIEARFRVNWTDKIFKNG